MTTKELLADAAHQFAHMLEGDPFDPAAAAVWLSAYERLPKCGCRPGKCIAASELGVEPCQSRGTSNA